MKRSSLYTVDGHVCLFGKQFHSMYQEPINVYTPSSSSSSRNISNGNK